MRDVCARRGFDAARTEEIARQAGVSKGTLYRFFRSKEELFLATVLASYEEAAEILAPAHAATGGAPLARLDALLEGLVRALPVLSEQMTVNFQAWGVVARDPAARARLFAALRERYAEDGALVAALVHDARAQGALRSDADPERLVRTLFSVFDGFLYRSTFDPEQACAEHLRASLRGVIDPLRTEPDAAVAVEGAP